MVLCRPAERLLAPVAAAALLAALGGGAIAAEGGANRPLVPTAELGVDGGVSAPAPAGADGGVQAPGEEGSPAPPQPAAPAPVPMPAETVEADVAPAARSDSARPGEEQARLEVAIPPVTSERSPAGLEGGGLTAPEPDGEPSQPQPQPQPPPAPGAIDGAAREPLVPVMMLGAPVGPPERTAPLIDLAPARVAAAVRAAGPSSLAPIAELAQAGADEEVVIPVDPGDLVDPDETPADGGGGSGEETGAGAAPGTLALTGRELRPLLAAALLLLLLGIGLRISVAPAASSPARA